MSDLLVWLAEPAAWQGPSGLPRRTLEHLAYSYGATALAAAVALPVALWLGHRGRGHLAATQIGNLGRAVPTFGVILGAFTVFGYGLTPVYVALVALAVPPILVNGIAGVRQVDRDVVEAARGMGMTGPQVLWRVELPLALPVIMAGLRTAAVQVVATATLAAVVGLGGLGRPIIDGLAQGVTFNPRARSMVIAGAAAVALLSAFTELGLGTLQRLSDVGAGQQPRQKGTTMRFMRRSVHKSKWAAMLALVMLVAGCGGGNTGGSDGTERGRLVVGSTDFSEQEVVANMYALVLEQAGYDVERRFQLGQREIVLPALQAGEIDLYPEYVGTALEFLNGGQGEATSDTEATTVKLREAFAEHDIAVLEPAPAQDRNGLVVTAATAEEHDLTTVSDLAPVAQDMVFGGPPECPQRPLCLQGYEEAYGLTFREFRPLDTAGPVTWAALEGGDIDVALMFTTQGIIDDEGWVLLEEDADLQPAENIVPVVREQVVNDEIRELLNAVSAELTTPDITRLNRQVDVGGEDPEDVARTWLQERELLDAA